MVTQFIVVHLNNLAVHLATSGSRSSRFSSDMHGFFFRNVMDLGILAIQLLGLVIWIGFLMPALILVSKGTFN